MGVQVCIDGLSRASSREGEVRRRSCGSAGASGEASIVPMPLDFEREKREDRTALVFRLTQLDKENEKLRTVSESH